MGVAGVATRVARRIGYGWAVDALVTARSYERQRDAMDREHLRFLARWELPRDAGTVDVGAHVGAVLDDLLTAAPDGRHFAFEPIPELAADLRMRFPQVTVMDVAVADREGTERFNVATAYPAMSALDRAKLDRSEDYLGPTRPMTVRTAPLDDLLPADYMPALIKIDVEGAEMLVLRGAQDVLKRSRPIVVCEHGDNDPELYDLLTDAGLEVWDIDGGGPYSVERFREAQGFWTWIGRPRSR